MRPIVMPVYEPQLQAAWEGDLGLIGRRIRRRVRRHLKKRLRRGPLGKRFVGRGGRRRFRGKRGLALAFGRKAVVVPVAPSGLAGDDDDPGLGRLRLRKRLKKVGKRLKKVVKSKYFKYAAIGAGLYFAAPLALKYGAKIGAKKGFGLALRKGMSKLRKGRGGAFAKTYAQARLLPPAPGSEAYEAEMPAYAPVRYPWSTAAAPYEAPAEAPYTPRYQAAGVFPGVPMSEEEEITAAEERPYQVREAAAGAATMGPILIGGLALMGLAFAGGGKRRR